MILISSEEACYLREKKMGNFIVVSSKTHKSKAKKYYLTENQKALDILNGFRKSVKVS